MEPKPTAVAQVLGENSRFYDDPYSSYPIESLSPPDHLTDTARELWDWLVHKMAPIGLITEPDRIALECLCETYSLWCLAAEDVRSLGREGRYYWVGSRLTPHPSLNLLDQIDSRLKGWLGEFGLTPSARARWRGRTPVQELDDEEGLTLELEALNDDERSALRQLFERHEQEGRRQEYAQSPRRA